MFLGGLFRSDLVRQVLDGDADYMWFLDQDADFVPETLDRLLSRKMPIVSALEMMRLPGCCYPMALKEAKAREGLIRSHFWMIGHVPAE